MLACTYYPEREPNLLVPSPPTFLFILTSLPRLSACEPPRTIVWDTQTSIIIKNIATWAYGTIAFSGDQRTITFFELFDFHTYDGLSGEQMCKGEFLPSSDHHLGAYWVYKDTLQFAMGFETDGKFMIDIRELQPTSDPLLPVVESFSVPVPHEDSTFCFCPVSFHASFVSWLEVIILDVRGSKVLFHTKATQAPYKTSAHFSPDGHFFACETSKGEICIWENTPAGYVSWSSLRPRALFGQFLFSPTAISILCLGAERTQLLRLENHANSLPYGKVKSRHHIGKHLVVCSTSGTHIATGRENCSIVTVLDLSNGTQQSINTNMSAEDINIVDNTIFVTDGWKLFYQHLGIGRMVLSDCGDRREDTGLHAAGGNFRLSHDCSQIAFTFMQMVFLYDIKTQKVIGELATDADYVAYFQFSPDGRQLWLIGYIGSESKYICYRVELERTRSPYFTIVNTTYLEGEWSCDNLFRPPHEYRIIGSGSEWVSDSRGNVLWLPLSWRVEHGLRAEWNGNFLALVDSYHPEPVIIEFQPSPGLPHLCPTSPLDMSPLLTSLPMTT